MEGRGIPVPHVATAKANCSDQWDARNVAQRSPRSFALRLCLFDEGPLSGERIERYESCHPIIRNSVARDGKGCLNEKAPSDQTRDQEVELKPEQRFT
jgi:hypothetical protein